MTIPRRPLWSALLLAASAGRSAVPGLFAIQERRNPGPNSAAADYFGGSEPRWVGDLDGDGIEDLVMGTPRAAADSGAISLLFMTSSGAVKDRVTIPARDPLIGPQFEGVGRQQFGASVAVVKPFSAAGGCATLMATSGNVPKLWTIQLCREAGTFSLRTVRTTDTSAGGALHGVPLGSSFGASLQTIDTAGEGLVALGLPTAGPTATAYNGKVLLLKLDTATRSAKRVSEFPKSWDSDDMVGRSVPSKARFGQSIVRLRGMPGRIELGVLAPGTAAGSKSGRLHRIILDPAGEPVAAGWATLAAGTDTVGAPVSISAADFDHDGMPDLLVGSPANAADQSGFWVATLDTAGQVKGLQPFRPGINGFADSSTTLGAGSYLGASVLAGDLDHDGMIDAVVGAKGGASVAGCLWGVRLKSAPWRVREPDTLVLDKLQGESSLLRGTIGGTIRSWSLRELDGKGALSPARCGIQGAADAAALVCRPAEFDGASHWRVVARDTFNIPADQGIADSADFVVVTAGARPFSFSGDTIEVSLSNGADVSRPLDTLDWRLDTLQYRKLGDWPAWISLGRFALVVSGAAHDTTVRLAACKTLQPGDVEWCPDSVVVRIRVATGIVDSRTRSARVFSRRGEVVVEAGGEALRATLWGTDGRRLGEMRVGPGQRRILDASGAKGSTVAIELREGGRSNRFLLHLER